MQGHLCALVSHHTKESSCSHTYNKITVLRSFINVHVHAVNTVPRNNGVVHDPNLETLPDESELRHSRIQNREKIQNNRMVERNLLSPALVGLVMQRSCWCTELHVLR